MSPASADLPARESAVSPRRRLGELRPRRPIDWLLAAALLSLPLAPFLNTFSSLGTAVRLLIAAAAVLLLLSGRIPLSRPLLGRGRWLIVGFALVQLVAVVGAVTADFGLVRAINWMMFVPFAFVAYDRRSQRTVIAYATLAGLALVTGLLLQAMDVLGGTWAGYVLSDGTPTTRYTSLLLNPNDLGLFALSLGVVLGLVSRGGDRRVRVAGLCAVVVCGLVVSVTYSRGALLAAAAVLLYLLVAGVAWRSLAQLSVAAAVGILVIPLALPSTRESMAVALESFAAIVGGEDRSSSVRADRWSRLTGGEGTEVAVSEARNGLPSWTVASTAGAAATAEVARDGKTSARLVRKRDGDGAQRISLSSPVKSVEQGLTYTLAGHCRPQRTPRLCRATIVFRNARGAILTAPVGRDVMSKPGRWTRITRTDGAPAGAVLAEVRADILAAPEGETHYLDSFLLVQEPADSLPFTEGRDDPLGLAPVPIPAPPQKAEARPSRPAAVVATSNVSTAPSTLPPRRGPAAGSEPSSPPEQAALSGEVTVPEILFGAGYGGYAEPGRLSRFDLANQRARQRAQIGVTVDNGWLKLFLEEGLLGLGLFLAIFVAALWRSFSARRSAERVLALTTGAVLVALGVRALSADVLDINPWNFLVWLLVGLAFTAASGEGERRSEPAQAPR
ncbi:MAG: hypothetical protein M3481_11215 [Actinomycetota bacterium]|nr:hypothetical protein [Actinomycetota bacterium]